MRMTLARAAALGSLALLGCGRDAILHGAAEAQVTEVLVALDEAGIPARAARDDAADGAWQVEVAPADAGRARRLLVERALPRAGPDGFGEVFKPGGLVPTPSEEQALYLHALSGELARTVEAVEGVVEARVHLALPPPDPLRAGPAAPARAALLVKARPGAHGAVEALAPGLRAIVAGGVPGLSADAVSVVITDARPPAPAPQRPRRARPLLLALAVLAGVTAAAVGLAGRGAWKRGSRIAGAARQALARWARPA